MPRIERGLMDNGIYHVINRGNGRQTVFHKDRDYESFQRESCASERKSTDTTG